MAFHLHVPKPIHGWRQFFNEVAVIAVGIAIALGGEELVSSWHERHQAHKSLEAIKDEVEVNLGRMKARMSIADCIDNRLDEVAAYVERPEGKKRPSWVGRPQVWTMQDGAVGAARSYGSLTILPRDDQITISTLYSTLAQFAYFEEAEQWAWAELRSITEAREISDSDQASLRQASARSYSAWLSAATAEQRSPKPPLGMDSLVAVDGSRRCASMAPLIGAVPCPARAARTALIRKKREPSPLEGRKPQPKRRRSLGIQARPEPIPASRAEAAYAPPMP